MSKKQIDPVYEALETVSELVSFHATAISKLSHVQNQLYALIDDKARLKRPAQEIETEDENG